MVPILTSLIDFPLNFFLLISGFLVIFLWHLIRIISKLSISSEKISLKNYWVFLCIFFIIINITMKNKLYFLEVFKP